MSKLSFLDMQYYLSKKKFLQKPSRMFSRDLQNFGLLPIPSPTSEELRQVFDRFDINKDGKISPHEYKTILKAIGNRDFITKEVQKIFEVADLDGDGFIDFNEFMEAYKKAGGVKKTDLQIAFRAFDKDSNGKITAEEVKELLHKLGESCSLRDCRRMVRAVDTNGDGVIDFDEFMTMMTRNMSFH
ncbi:calmodulin 1 [Olea europaea subsp. europaea]|uniref:Calmodulin 1 n=1 Tax=Olea europaea subsp. europaea TaxID=158383 RepID=A0A8S0SRH3_OLEEU|nr:calmodulin 1 [Olea europaea subsp. europaea]